jgi:hypothetical protein
MLNTIDQAYCKALNIFNPYATQKYRLNKSIPKLDIRAFKENPRYQFVYDKLFIAKSQGMACGTLEELLAAPKEAEYPLFIKPRYGHLSASSKDCYKIKKPEDLQQYAGKKHMMWSEFVDATEGMTDFVLINGEIVYQLSYVYSDAQNGFSDVWKLISPESTPPESVVEWVDKHMGGYTGPLNIQYRATKIIEVGMRFARGGMYLESTENKTLIDAINDMWVTKTWNHKDPEKLSFKPFYSFKCWSPIPLVYIFPQHMMDTAMKYIPSMPFYEYYFEPTGSHSLVFFQFLARDFDRSMQVKRVLEILMVGMNIVFVALIVVAVLTRNSTVIWVCVGIFVTSLINSLEILQGMIKHQAQFLF